MWEGEDSLSRDDSAAALLSFLDFVLKPIL